MLHISLQTASTEAAPSSQHAPAGTRGVRHSTAEPRQDYILPSVCSLVSEECISENSNYRAQGSLHVKSACPCCLRRPTRCSRTCSQAQVSCTCTSCQQGSRRRSSTHSMVGITEEMNLRKSTMYLQLPGVNSQLLTAHHTDASTRRTPARPARGPPSQPSPSAGASSPSAYTGGWRLPPPRCAGRGPP